MFRTYQVGCFVLLHVASLDPPNTEFFCWKDLEDLPQALIPEEPQKCRVFLFRAFEAKQWEK